jgi:hypothetical protein
MPTGIAASVFGDARWWRLVRSKQPRSGANPAPRGQYVATSVHHPRSCGGLVQSLISSLEGTPPTIADLPRPNRFAAMAAKSIPSRGCPDYTPAAPAASNRRVAKYMML